MATQTGDDSFVGREAILDVLLSLLDDARTGRVRVALISGEPGIGKTHLMIEFARLAASRCWSVAWGRSFEGADAPPLWPWVHVIREIGVAQLDLPAHVLTALASLIPEIDTEHGELVGEGAAFRLFDAVRALIAAASRREPVLVVLDDLQWADPSTSAASPSPRRRMRRRCRRVRRHLSRTTRRRAGKLRRGRLRSRPPARDRTHRTDRVVDRRRSSSAGDRRHNRRRSPRPSSPVRSTHARTATRSSSPSWRACSAASADTTTQSWS